MAYKDKVDPTRDGFQEIWDSIQDPTIEDLMAGIQSRKTTQEQILNLTGDLRNNHTLLDKELYRLGEFSNDYNSKWATKKSYTFGTTEELQVKSQSQLKRWRKMLKITTPRYNRRLANTRNKSIYTESYLTKRPYELDMWGPASYGTLMFDLYNEMTVLINHLEEGKHLCQDVIRKEEEIDQNPKWKEELHDKQFQSIADSNHNIIEKRFNEGIVDTNNRIYKEMVSSNSKLEFKSNGFHKYHEQEYVDYVVTLSTLNLQENDTTPTEHQLFGDNFGKIKLLRFINGHLDDLLNVNGNGKFDKHEILELIKWCDVKESPKKHEDSERILFELIKSRYHGSHRWYGWPSIFTLNQIIKDSSYESMVYSEQFERKLNRFLVDCGLKREDITGDCTQK